MANLDYEALVDFRSAVRNELKKAIEARDIAYIRGPLKGERDAFDLMVARHGSIENKLTILTGKIFEGLLLDTDLSTPKSAIMKSTENLNITYKKINDVEKVLSVLAEFAELISTIATSVTTGSIAKIGKILGKIDKIANSLGDG